MAKKDQNAFLKWIDDKFSIEGSIVFLIGVLSFMLVQNYEDWITKIEIIIQTGVLSITYIIVYKMKLVEKKVNMKLNDTIKNLMSAVSGVQNGNKENNVMEAIKDGLQNKSRIVHNSHDIPNVPSRK